MATSSRRAPDATKLLIDQHAAVKKMFRMYEKTKDDATDDEKRQLAERICKELKLHTSIEEEIFYPAMREASDDEDLLDEAEVEHASAKDLIAQIESSAPGSDLYDAKVKVLGEYVSHHVEEEEGEMFPKARRVIDVKAIGARLDERTTALQAEMNITEPPPVPAVVAAKKAARQSAAAAKKAPAKKAATKVAKKATAKKATAKKAARRG